VKKSEKILFKHSPEYRKYIETTEKHEDEEKLKTQGEILAKAIGGKMDELLKAQANSQQASVGLQAPQAAGGLPAPQFPPAPPGVPPPGGTSGTPKAPKSKGKAPGTKSGEESSEEEDNLTATQRKLASAELSHVVTFKKGSREEFAKVLRDKWSNRALSSSMQRVFKQYREGKAPKTKEDRITALFDIFKGT